MMTLIQLRQFKAQLENLRIQSNSHHKSLLAEMRVTVDPEIRSHMNNLVHEFYKTSASLRGEIKAIDQAISETTQATQPKPETQPNELSIRVEGAARQGSTTLGYCLAQSLSQQGYQVSLLEEYPARYNRPPLPANNFQDFQLPSNFEPKHVTIRVGGAA